MSIDGHESELAEKLTALPQRLRAAFAAACAQRQLPNYLASSSVNPTGDPTAIMPVLNDLWDAIETGSFDRAKLQKGLDSCELLVSDEDTKYFDGIEYADDAVYSLLYAIDTALGDGVEEAVWAARRPLEALSVYVRRRCGIESTPESVHRVRAHALSRAEVERQQSDLTDLRHAANVPGQERAIIAQIRRRAEKDSASFFG
jgi:uncharacterized protein